MLNQDSGRSGRNRVCAAGGLGMIFIYDALVIKVLSG